MNPRVTQSDIARVAGVHNTTVSLALRNHPAISEPTRKRIRAIAEELGYAPDPALQALVAYRNGRMPNRRQETLAYVTNWYSKWGWQDESSHARHHAGAQRKAAECGFQLEHFWLGEAGMSQRRLNSMLFHRGITGLIVAAHRPDADVLSELDWPRLSVVKIGCFPSSPPLHRVTEDHAGAVCRAFRSALAAGRQRVGFVLPRATDELADEAWSAAFIAQQFRLPVETRIPPLLFGPGARDPSFLDQPRTVNPAVLEQWFVRHQPDVIFSFGPVARTQLDALGLAVPRDLAYVDLALEPAEAGIAGVRENGERIGEMATEMLVWHMQQNQRGVPSVATTTLVEGTWTDGDSLPAVARDRAWSARSSARYTELVGAAR